MLASTSICFDLSVFELFAPLSRGGKVILAENALLLPQLLASGEVTLINTVPSAIAELLRIKGIPSNIRTINLAGEPLPLNLVRQLYQQTNVTQVFNLYGPSEDTTYSTFTLVRPEDSTVTIGRPIANTQVYILDPNLNPVPIGIRGELYISGEGLARGYLNRPELTAQKFIPNPFNNKPQSQLYKTGDLVRYLANGNIDYLGRLDHQVKIRGFRIEIGEIEAVLRAHSQVKNVVVVAREDRPGEKRLVAYLVAGETSVTALRTFVSKKLPEYMIPSAFVMLDALPLTPNGKVNRQALPAPEIFRLELEAYVAPRSSTEEILARIWVAVLGLERVGIYDNFFFLGGHSLLATQLVTRIRESFQVDLPLRSLFETPTIADLAVVIDAQIDVSKYCDRQTIVPVLRQRNLPLSFAQQRLWFLSQLDISTAYNITEAVQMSGLLNLKALRASLNEIVRRHEVLRTSFTINMGQAIQVIAPFLELSLPVVDLSALSEKWEASKQLIREDANQPFNLEQASLLRVKLLRFSPTEHILVLSMHHIISDGWSMGVIVREVAALYEAFSTGQENPLSPLTIQYADFAVWQREWLADKVLSTQLTYWQQQLAGSDFVLNLPTDRPRPVVQTFIGKKQALNLPKSLHEELKALSQRQGVTLFMTLLTVFQVLLHRYTQQDDILVGTPIANRNLHETEGLIGMFVNTLVMRADFSDNPSFSSLLQQVREMALAAYANQDLPFEKLVEVLQGERDTSRNPLFQAMFVLQNAPLPALSVTGLKLQTLPVDNQTAMFDLTMSLAETGEGIEGWIEYNTDLFDADTIRRMKQHFQILLAAIVEQPTQQISNLSLLTPAEEHQLLVWGKAESETSKYQVNCCLHELFESQVERSPDAIALTFEDKQLTYQQLNQKANKVAHHLQKLGVKPEVSVGICMERSLDMVIGILGILKAGGAYVPLDPNYPTERLFFTLQDASVSVLLTQQGLLELPENNTKIVCIDTAITENTDTNPSSPANPDNRAYIIYTSGSTGKPKGVEISHTNVVRLFQATQYWYNFNQQDVWTLFHSYAFDFSVWELWGALLYGGRLVVVPYWVSHSPEEFYQLLCRENVTVLNQTPSAFRQLIRIEETSGISKKTELRLVIFGGEALDLQSLKPWFERHGDRHPQLINMYGITETTVHVTYRPLTAADLIKANGSVIGRQIPDLQLYILDKHRQLVPIGVRGEIYIGGAGVARGYLNRPDLNAEKFIPNPFSNQPNARLYKSGDLGRYLLNGDIEYLGRIDHQVKIRGFRIELGEIEAVLHQHPAVRETTVIVRSDTPGEKLLVAYIVPKSEQIPDSSELRNFLAQQLPDYLVPQFFMILDAIPLTPNGKVDRRVLPIPDGLRPELRVAYIAPTTDLQQTIATIWQQVLQLEKVGVEDNFFDLGGHSLLMVQLHSQLQTNLKQELSIIELFQYPTISSLSQHLSATNDTQDDSKTRLEKREEGKNRLKQRLKNQQK